MTRRSHFLQAALIVIFAGLAMLGGCQKRPTTSRLRPDVAVANNQNSQAVLPRVPPANRNVTLFGQVNNLAYGTALSLTVNAATLPAVVADGIVQLLTDIPIGTLYDVSVAAQPRGQICSIVSAPHGAVGLTCCCEIGPSPT